MIFFDDLILQTWNLIQNNKKKSFRKKKQDLNKIISKNTDVNESTKAV